MRGRRWQAYGILIYSPRCIEPWYSRKGNVLRAVLTTSRRYAGPQNLRCVTFCIHDAHVAHVLEDHERERGGMLMLCTLDVIAFLWYETARVAGNSSPRRIHERKFHAQSRRNVSSCKQDDDALAGSNNTRIYIYIYISKHYRRLVTLLRHVGVSCFLSRANFA